MSRQDPFDDDVPVADAVEQQRPAAEPDDVATLDPAERVPAGDDPAPLESDAADWRDQHTDVETDPEEDFR